MGSLLEIFFERIPFRAGTAFKISKVGSMGFLPRVPQPKSLWAEEPGGLCNGSERIYPQMYTYIYICMHIYIYTHISLPVSLYLCSLSLSLSFSFFLYVSIHEAYMSYSLDLLFVIISQTRQSVEVQSGGDKVVFLEMLLVWVTFSGKQQE